MGVCSSICIVIYLYTCVHILGLKSVALEMQRSRNASGASHTSTNRTHPRIQSIRNRAQFSERIQRAL